MRCMKTVMEGIAADVLARETLRGVLRGIAPFELG
jgi:hypothetical protein